MNNQLKYNKLTTNYDQCCILEDKSPFNCKQGDCCGCGKCCGGMSACIISEYCVNYLLLFIVPLILLVLLVFAVWKIKKKRDFKKLQTQTREQLQKGNIENGIPMGYIENNNRMLSIDYSSFRTGSDDYVMLESIQKTQTKSQDKINLMKCQF